MAQQQEEKVLDPTKRIITHKRVKRELDSINENPRIYCSFFVTVTQDDYSVLIWTGLVLPHPSSPYSEGAFRIRIVFPPEYPFKPPKIKFLTKIYHPNINEKGEICLPIIHADNWKPATTADQVIQALVAMVNDPDTDNALRRDLAEEFKRDRKKFIINAGIHTELYSEERPEIKCPKRKRKK